MLTINLNRLLVGISLLIGSQSLLQAAETHDRVKDPVYGHVLYEYHQGHAFEALSLLKVAAHRGGAAHRRGIRGHGDHPGLVEGGLLLSYGMVLEAKQLFEKLLKQQISTKDRNLAWFYLGKVFYLQQDNQQALASFANIRLSPFQLEETERFYELLYIKGQMAAPEDQQGSKQWLQALPAEHIFRFYLRYNQAVALSRLENQAAAIASLQQLAFDMQAVLRALALQNETDAELAALLDQTLVSQAQLQMQALQTEAALETVKAVDREGIFAAQALFIYALAASQLQRYEQAFTALTQLKEQRLLNPWRQQSPYALAYLYEQMKEPVLALEAYRAAVAHYENLQVRLQDQRSSMNEQSLLEDLNLNETIGQASLPKDAYGRVQAAGYGFNFATLLASENFQLQLSELHELYLLKNSMSRWARQLDSFDAMLETRQLARRQKLAALQDELRLKEVDKWQQQTDRYQQQIDQALSEDNAHFFMTKQQLAYYKRIRQTQARLQDLPDSHPDKQNYQTRLQRVAQYFNWWIEDEFTINRWRTVKSMQQLQHEMTQFRQQYEGLASEQESDATHLSFVERLDEGHQRLASLQQELELSIDQSSNKLLALVDQAMVRQAAEIADYLLASREALARVSDQLLSASQGAGKGGDAP